MAIPPKIYYVDPSFHDIIFFHEFSTLQAAIDQIPAWQKAKIIIYDNIVTPPLKLTNENTNITIDGLDTFGIQFNSGSMVDIENGQILKFRNISYIRGERLIINSDSTIGFYNCQSTMCSITLDSGKYSHLYIDHTNFYGNHGPVIQVNNSYATMDIFYSNLKGDVGYSAILFNSNSDKKLKAKHSIFLHGSDGTSIQLSGIYTVGVYIYDCASNKRICNNDLIAWIYEDSCKSDLEITF